MNQKNILPYDGLAYLVAPDTEGEFEWPKVTECLAETTPWRIETARLFIESPAAGPIAQKSSDGGELRQAAGPAAPATADKRA
jgi:hypothetical protein